jgi:hypothetical protein
MIVIVVVLDAAGEAKVNQLAASASELQHVSNS